MSIFKTFEFATQSLKSLPTLCLIIKENQQMNYLLYFLLEKKLFLVTIMTFNEQCNNRCSLHFNTKWMCKKKKKKITFFLKFFLLKNRLWTFLNRDRIVLERIERNRKIDFFSPPLVGNWWRIDMKHEQQDSHRIELTSSERLLLTCSVFQSWKPTSKCSRKAC